MYLEKSFTTVEFAKRAAVHVSNLITLANTEDDAGGGNSYHDPVKSKYLTQSNSVVLVKISCEVTGTETTLI